MLRLFRHGNYALLWIGGFISQTGDWLLEIGLPIAVYLLTGSALITSTVFIVELLPSLLFGSVAGVLVDRWDRRRILIIGNLLQALALLPLLAIHHIADLWLVYVVSLLEALLNLVTRPAVNALLPRLVGEDEVLQANSLASLGSGMARLLGAPLGGVVIGLWGLTGVVVLDAVTFVMASLLIFVMHTKQAQTHRAMQESQTRAGFWHAWSDGLRLIGQNARLRALVVIGGLQSLAQGIFLILYIIFILRVLHGNTTDVGLIRGVQAIGALLGGIIVGSIGHRFRLTHLIAACTIAFGLLDLLIWDAPLLYPSLLLTAVLFVIVGIPGAGMGAGMLSLLQREVEDTYRGRVLATFDTVSSLLLAIGLALAGTLSDQIGVLPVLNGQGTLFLLAGLMAILTLHPRQAANSFSAGEMQEQG